MAGPRSWLVGLGAAQVVLGGLVAAVTGPLQLPRGSWLAAYLVLVGGVGQYAIGRAPSWLGLTPSRRAGWAELAGWNLANLAVVLGTLTRLPLVVDVGGVVLAVVLVLLLRDVLRARRDTTGPRWARVGYAVLLLVLLVSIPVGLVLAHLRAG